MPEERIEELLEQRDFKQLKLDFRHDPLYDCILHKTEKPASQTEI